jgi:NAD-dependent dihydropyrimidine dehydrogenase PreA subunit
MSNDLNYSSYIPLNRLFIDIKRLIKMTALIFQEKCISCGWCVNVCPHQIILFDKNEKAIILEEKKCIECGACALQCPTQAILSHPLGCGCVGSVLKNKLRIIFRLKKESCC